MASRPKSAAVTRSRTTLRTAGERPAHEPQQEEQPPPQEQQQEQRVPSAKEGRRRSSARSGRRSEGSVKTAKGGALDELLRQHDEQAAGVLDFSVLDMDGGWASALA